MIGIPNNSGRQVQQGITLYILACQIDDIKNFTSRPSKFLMHFHISEMMDKLVRSTCFETLQRFSLSLASINPGKKLIQSSYNIVLRP